MNPQPDQHTTLQLRNDLDSLYEITSDIQAWTRQADQRLDRLEADVTGLKTDVAAILRILDERLPAP